MILFLLLLAAIVGVLGAVLKGLVALFLIAVTAAIVLVAGTWWWLRHKVRSLQSEMDRRTTQIRIGDYRRTGDESPAPRDDRY